MTVDISAAAEEHNLVLPASYDITWTAIAAVGLVLAVTALVHLARRKDTTPTATALWALVILAAPILGPAAYLLAGRRRPAAHPLTTSGRDGTG